MTLRERIRLAVLRRDLSRFSAVVLAPSLLDPAAQRDRLRCYFTISPGEACDLAPRLCPAFSDVEHSARWAAQMGFFPVVILAADVEPYRELSSETIWVCSPSDLDRVLSSRHVVPCAGIDVASRIREFYT